MRLIDKDWRDRPKQTIEMDPKSTVDIVCDDGRVVTLKVDKDGTPYLVGQTHTLLIEPISVLSVSLRAGRKI